MLDSFYSCFTYHTWFRNACSTMYLPQWCWLAACPSAPSIRYSNLEVRLIACTKLALAWHVRYWWPSLVWTMLVSVYVRIRRSTPIWKLWYAKTVHLSYNFPEGNLMIEKTLKCIFVTLHFCCECQQQYCADGAPFAQGGSTWHYQTLERYKLILAAASNIWWSMKWIWWDECSWYSRMVVVCAWMVGLSDQSAAMMTLHLGYIKQTHHRCHSHRCLAHKDNITIDLQNKMLKLMS